MNTVTHRDFGNGEVTKIDSKYIHIDFGWRGIKAYSVAMFDAGVIVANSPELLKRLNALRRKIAKRNPKVARSYGMDSFFTGGVAEDIKCSPDEFFEAIGYIAKNAKYIEAEIAQYKVEIFEEMFSTDICYIHNDSENNRNQFRIDFARTENMPKILEENLIEACGAGRIAKSLFVEKLVKEFGFAFGSEQDIEKIKEIAKRRGYLSDFERGFNL